MAIFTLGKLLDRVDAFEDRLIQFYAAVRDHSRDNEAKLLIYYLARHRKHLQQASGKFGQQELTLARHIKIQGDIPFTPDAERKLLQANPSTVNGKTLLETALTYDTQLVQFYSCMLKATKDPVATSLIKSLIRLEQSHKLMLKKLIDMNYF